MRLRSKAREVTLILLYQVEISKIDYRDAFQNYLSQNTIPQETVDFSFSLFEGVIKNLKYLDSLIQKYVKNWEIDRMAAIDRNILRIGCFELAFLKEIPPKVAINESIELAKRFGDLDSPRFINGILDKVYKTGAKASNDEMHRD